MFSIHMTLHDAALAAELQVFATKTSNSCKHYVEVFASTYSYFSHILVLCPSTSTSGILVQPTEPIIALALWQFKMYLCSQNSK